MLQLTPLFSLAFLVSIGGAAAAPMFMSICATTPLLPSSLSSLARYAQFAQAAYCSTSKLSRWDCGATCNALPGFQPTLVGGDGNAVQIYFVGYWPAENSVIVAHEGTDPVKLVSVLTDVNILQDPLDTGLFPGVSSNILVHDGFRNAHALTAPKILFEVKRLMVLKNTNTVTVIGHSLGGALAELDALYLALNLHVGSVVRARTFGTPRVGNAAFADLLDSKIPDYKRTNNKKDIIPIVPGRFLNFSHGQGEVHILGPENAVACSGQDNDVDVQCQIKTVPNIFDGNLLDHLGPYEGVYIGTVFCA